MLPIKFQLSPTYGWEEMLFEEFPETIWISEQKDLAILNLYVTVMPPIKFRLNLTYRLGGDVVWRISRWLPYIMDIRTEKF